MIEYIEQYISQPHVQIKLAFMYPSVISGLPSDTTKHSSLQDAVANLASRAYYQRKEAALIRAGLDSLKEVYDGQHN